MPAVACFSWLTTWRDHSAILPNSSRVPNAWWDDTRVWSVTADFGGGPQTIHGDAWCGISPTVPPTAHDDITGTSCWCRRTTMEVSGSWSSNISDAFGSGTESCSGSGSASCVGPWVRVYTFGTAMNCAFSCSNNCSWCIHEGENPGGILCLRPEILE